MLPESSVLSWHEICLQSSGLKLIMYQRTISNPIEIKGVGLHTGVETNLRLRPAPENTGYVFVRTDLDNFEIPASVEFIGHCSYATTLVRRGVVLSTCEHLLSALRGADIDNCFIDIDNIEVPILDGSSENFYDLIIRTGIEEQNSPRRYLRVLQKISIEQDERKMSVEPAERFEIDCTIQFPHPLIEKQQFTYIGTNGNYGREIASARTFGFTQEIELLRKANLALGGSLDNAIVLTPEGMLNRQPLRFSDEFVRHKILDIIGDVALIGLPLLGKIVAYKTGHAIHSRLMSRLLENTHAWNIVESTELADNFEHSHLSQSLV